MGDNPQLQKAIDNLGLKKEDYVFLTIKTVYLYKMKSGEKNVEYRDPGEFIFSRLYHDYARKKFSEPKKLSHILFQAGYNPDSPRMLIELKGWNHHDTSYPGNLDTTGHEIDRRSVNLLLGDIIFENLDMSREKDFRSREERSYGSPVKSAKEIAALKSRLSNRRSRIGASATRKK